MVVIKPEENEETLAEQSPPNPKASSSTAKTTTDSSNDDNTGTTATSATKGNGNDSDGFETASEREVSDDEEEDDNEQTKNNSTTSDQDQQREEEAKNDDEAKQRRLAEANEAKLRGNKLFGNGEYEEALIQYDTALQVAPPDMLLSVELRSNCHSNRAICFFKLGKYEDTIKECTKALELNPSYMKALVRRGEAHEKLELFEEAIADMKKILELDPSNDQARRAIHRLEPLAAEKREKMKEEMIAKLKEMGNSVLGRFGMSIDNFKAVKDPNTGSYSLSFQR